MSSDRNVNHSISCGARWQEKILRRHFHQRSVSINALTGNIPKELGKLQNLLSLSFSSNNFSGSLPPELGNLTKLQQIYIDSAGMSGEIPPTFAKLRNLNIVPIHLYPPPLTLAHITGFLMNIIPRDQLPGAPLGMNVLRPDVSLSTVSEGSRLFTDSDFAINCGGDTLRTSDTNYERDNETLGVASYYVTTANSWAVSSVGRYLEGTNVAYTRFTQQTFSNALNLQLFQSIRLSPVSLRYYGLGLENGNYTVNLQFADIDFPDSATWQSVGRRVFDIYIQGTLQVKDFDIKKAAGGVTFKAVEEILTARVSDNYLEIHLLWAGKGTCCIPSPGTYGPAISAIKVTPDFIPSVRPPATSTKNKKIGLIVGISVSIVVVGVLSIFVFIWRKRSKMRSNDEDEDFLGMDSRPNTFGYGELKTATEGFSPANKLGEGGFGPVYKGTLPDGRMVAVKQLSVASHQGKSQFVAEIAIISAVQQRNLVKLYGCCIEGDERLLVYEYLENKSLDQALFGKSNLLLNWATRFDICLGTARGLAYLHEESRPRIVHRDVKASNILLDADLNPKISDFGLAKLYDDKVTHISTRVAGTIGYLAPEYAMRGHLTEKADVFAFGVVTLEILSGRPNSSINVDPEKMYLLEWAWHLYENNCALELVDPTLSKFNEGQATRMIGVALLCIQASPMLRPPMSRVIAMLLGDIEVSTVTTRPGYLTDLPFRDTSSFMSESTSGASTSINTNSQLTSSSNASTVTHIESSPTNSAGPLLQEIVGNGR
ncbi:Protein kinase domain-containing protein [Cinnamomum micranthum f. kanehirae]|uniref:non-specific serine/threonine protein kinase n=1 Tax=Cinnamomum micranthum f. kanehirae TaxID=337451 RepID=A0A443PD08_9MAGN|nr:Protein kinase domain-containing protein [Cinnamomum micranthum f. kanehirae]